MLLIGPKEPFHFICSEPRQKAPCSHTQSKLPGFFAAIKNIGAQNDRVEGAGGPREQTQGGPGHPVTNGSLQITVAFSIVFRIARIDGEQTICLQFFDFSHLQGFSHAESLVISLRE